MGVIVGVGMRVGVGVGMRVGVGLGEGEVMTIWLIPPICTGAGKAIFGTPSNAPFINAVQTFAGKVPPVTEFKPPIPLSVRDAVSLKNATDAANCGMYPLNQAEAFCSLVPVFPAA